MTKMGNDEFTLHLISTASKDYFPKNILASFRKFRGLWFKTNGTMLCKANFTSFFPGHYRLRGIEIGALVSGIVRVALPFA